MADLKWFRDHLPPDGSAQIVDLTSSWCTLGLWGPRARDILAGITRDDVSHEGFPFATLPHDRDRTRCGCWPRASPTSATSAGSCTSRSSRAPKLWDMVWEAGQPHGVVPAGIGVYGTTGRLEKCYRAFGFELDGEYDVVEAGMAWGKVKDEDFVGKEAHVRHREEDPAAVMCTLTVDDHTSADGVKRYMLGGEPILTRDGEPLDRRQGPPLVRDQRRRRAVGRQAPADGLPAARARGGGRAAGGRVHGRALPGDGRGRRLDAAVRPRQRARQASGACA